MHEPTFNRPPIIKGNLSAAELVEAGARPAPLEDFREGYEAGWEDARRKVMGLINAWPNYDEFNNVMSISHGLLKELVEDLFNESS